MRYRTRELCIVERDECADWCYANNVKFQEIKISMPTTFWISFNLDNDNLLTYAKLKWDARDLEQ